MKSKNSGMKVEAGENNFVGIVNRVKWDMTPFFLSLIIYALFCVPMEQQTIFGMFIKCLPIVALQYFSIRNGVSLTQTEHSYERKIFLGLIFACIGDAFLDFPHYFMHGTISFAVAQMFNISAFGFKPLNITTGLKVLAFTSMPLLVILPKLNQEETRLLIVITCYTPLLKSMIWRAISRVSLKSSELDWPKVFGALGAISFGMSDSYLALNRYWKPMPYAQVIIMTTYYTAQFGIALSAVNIGDNNNKSAETLKNGTGKQKKVR